MFLALDGTTQVAGAVEETMLSNDKLFVVLAVVLIIWLGLAAFLYRTDRRIGHLERELAKRSDGGAS